jgi:heptosyltransferase-2
VKLAELGDALQISPALRELRRGLPDTRIDVLTTAGGAAVLRGMNLADRLIIFDKHRFDRTAQLVQPANIWRALQLGRELRRAKYDAVLLFHHLSTHQGTLKYAAFCTAAGAPRRLGLDNGRGFFLNEKVLDEGYGVHHEVDYALRLARLLVPEAERHAPRLEPTPEDLRAATELLAPLEGQSGPLIAIHPGSGAYAPARRWSTKRFAAVADHLIEAGARIVLLGGAEEHDLRRSMLAQMHDAGRVLDLGGRTTLHQLVAVLAACTLFAGNDSGVMHLAVAAGTPVLAIYGPTDPRAWGPWSPQSWQALHTFPNGVEVLRSGPHVTLKAAIACSPCIYRGRGLGDPNGCPDRTCLRRITVSQVFDTIVERLAELGAELPVFEHETRRAAVS